jgi:hypothetical protein
LYGYVVRRTHHQYPPAIKQILTEAMTGENGCARRARKGAVQVVYIPLITLELLFGTHISKAYHIQAKFTPKPARSLSAAWA